MKPSPVAPPWESWRLFFPTAALGAIAGLGAWGAQLGGVSLGISPLDHSAFMLWGVLGSGIQGFLFTGYAKQNDAPMVSPRALFALWCAQIGSAILLLLHPTALPAAARVVLLALPWAAVLAWAVPVAARSLRRRWDATTAAGPVAILGGLCGIVLHGLGTTSVRGVDLGVFPFVVLLALAILDRVLPFFSSRVTPGYTGLRKPWFLGPLAVLLWGRALAPAFAPGLLPWLSAALLGLLLRQWAGWRPWPAARTPAIAVLHLAISWFALSWVLGMMGAPATVSTHALLVGGMGSLLLGISMRVVRGHSGLPVVLGQTGVGVLALASLAAVIRVGAGLLGAPPAVYQLSAVVLGTAFLLWFVRFAVLCWRVPGKEGP